MKRWLVGWLVVGLVGVLVGVGVTVALVDRAVTDLGDPSGGFFDRPREDDGVGLLAERVRSI